MLKIVAKVVAEKRAHNSTRLHTANEPHERARSKWIPKQLFARVLGGRCRFRFEARAREHAMIPIARLKH